MLGLFIFFIAMIALGTAIAEQYNVSRERYLRSRRRLKN